MLPSAAAWSAPKAPEFGPAIDNLSYEGQEKCSPSPKPGVLAFQRMVLDSFGGGVGSISRACNVGGTSEHKEGRAWDWTNSAASPTDRRRVENFLEWLLKEDKYGNEAAMARRLGIMYVIWNKRIWGSWGGWDTYCVMKKGACRDPEDKTVLSPHTDHVHISFTWAGAKKQTTWWNPSLTFTHAFAPTPTGSGYWVAARNGSVLLWGSAGYFGPTSEDTLKEPIVDMAATPTGGGYWMVNSKGRVFAIGDARYRGKPDGNRRIVGITPTPTGKGYWIASRSGRVQPFGDAKRLGSVEEEDVLIVDIAATPTGLGYWLFSDRGRVFPFGDATMLGGAADEDLTSPVVAADNNGADGYWMVTESGRVLPFGTARFFGGTTDKKVDAPVTAIAGSALGDGYWLLTAKGRVFAFGEAGLATQRSAPGRSPRLTEVERYEQH